MSTVVRDLIDSLWDFRNPAESERRFAEAEAALASESPLETRLQLRTQRARAMGLQRRFDEALALLKEVGAQLTEQTPTAAIRHALEVGRVHNSAGRPAESLPHFRRALELAKRAGNENLAIDAAHMLAIAEAPENRRALSIRALEMAEAAHDPRARLWIGSICNNLGFDFLDSGDPAGALPFFERALAHRIERGQRVETLIARWTIARTYRALGRLDEALAMQRDLAAEWEREGSSDGYVFEELGEILLAQERPREAALEFAKAYAALSRDPWLAANEPARLERLRRLSAGDAV